MPVIEARRTRDEAHLLAFVLNYAAQAGDASAAGLLDELAVAAATRGWDEVERACSFGRAVMAHLEGRDSAQAVSLLVEQASSAGDDVMLALGLALRSNEAFAGNDPNGAVARDSDLARAVVLLERAEGPDIARIAAHKVCGVAFSTRSLFELGDEQYSAALAAGGGSATGLLDPVLAPIACNLAETQVCWAAMLRQLGDGSGLAARRRAWAATSERAWSFSMPAPQRLELRALELLLEAIAGGDTAAAAEALRRDGVAGTPPNARCAALLQLACALSSANAGRSEAALAAADAASRLDSVLQTHLFDLALSLVAELEAANGHPSGLAYGRRQLEQRWASRLSSLGAMQSLIGAERVAEQIEQLSRHAHLDDLTGVGNRRALSEFLTEMKLRDVESIGLVLIDVDDFKEVNDRHGHLAGDAALVAVASALTRGIRSGDLAARLGGDEFAVVLVDVGLKTALQRTRQLLAEVDRHPFAEVSPGLSVAVSAGVAAGPPANVPELWAAADAALYRAKAGTGQRIGRSRLSAPSPRYGGP